MIDEEITTITKKEGIISDINVIIIIMFSISYFNELELKKTNYVIDVLNTFKIFDIETILFLSTLLWVFPQKIKFFVTSSKSQEILTKKINLF